jgi:hypothetical protein
LTLFDDLQLVLTGAVAGRIDLELAAFASTTRVYVQRITVKTDKHSSKIARSLKQRMTN